VIEGGQRADHSDHDRHGMGVTAKAGEKPVHLLMHHSVHGHALLEIFILLLGRQLTVKKQVAGFQKVAVIRQFFDRISAMEQQSFITINKCQLGFTTRRGGKSWIVSEAPGITVQTGDIDDVRTDGALVNGQRVVLLVER